MTYAVALVAVGNGDQARSIAHALVEQRLAACVQIMPIESVYTWEGEVRHDDELLLLVKTRSELFPALEGAVRSLHEYEVPEILMIEVTAGHNPYLTWLDTALGTPDQVPP